ncbi:sensor histidine kinase [Defluviimonas sp. SAOS-178_SWC]|uniref:sensor histidine kinase n=1 Tax=Defluviimonas sp. SAOS-178_SWC TaxID=3121287 RepID=UPI0032215A68
MTDAPARRGVQDRLGYRVAFLLAVVLLPLTLISVFKSVAVREETLARSQAALMGETMRAASGELRLIQQARGAATVLSDAVWPLVPDDAECSALLRRLIEEESQYSLIAYVPESGISMCNSAGKRFDFAEDPLFIRASQDQKTSFAVKTVGLVSGASVLVISHPVFDEDGTYRGLVSLSLPHAGLRVAEDSGSDEHRPLTMITYDSSGTVLTASRQLNDIGLAIPRDRSLAALIGNRAMAFSAMSEADQPRLFSVVPLVPDELYALGSWPPEGASATSGILGAAPVLFPMLMWVASLVVAWLAVERFVIRHIRKLSRSLHSFASGNRMVGDIDVRTAPAEIRDMAEAYERMTETILHDEAELEDMVHQKEVLLREVHHRVKNNLQLIASIMNMQMRRTHSSEAKSIMKGLQDRVMSLATIHRELYQTAGLSDVHSDELLSTIVRQITNLADRPDRKFTVHTDFADIRMTPDQAVPLALLVAEAITNALKYAHGPGSAPAELWITLTRRSETRAELRVGNSLAARRAAEPDSDAFVGDRQSSGLGTQLVAAFAMQLGATVERLESDDVYELIVDFELRPLTEGEEREMQARTI